MSELVRDPCGVCGVSPRCPFPYEDGSTCDNCGATYDRDGDEWFMDEDEDEDES